MDLRDIREIFPGGEKNTLMNGKPYDILRRKNIFNAVQRD